MTDTKYTADELRRCADELMKSVDKMIDRGQVTKATYDKATQPTILLRAGADAMDDAKSLEESRDYWLKAATEANALHDKAEARVKELDEALRPIVETLGNAEWGSPEHAEDILKGLLTGYAKARAALQVKP